MRMWMRFMATVAAVAMLASCSSVEPNARYPDIAEFKEAAEKSGLKCKNWETLPEREESSMQGGKCDNHVFLYTAPSTLNLQGIALTLGFSMDDYESQPTILTAANWAVAGPEEHVKPLQRRLGGDFEEPSKLIQDFTDDINRKVKVK